MYFTKLCVLSRNSGYVYILYVHILLLENSTPNVSKVVEFYQLDLTFLC